MTIKEIAAKAGVSIATVSHVINHTRYVSPELVDKIEAIIEESGYSEKIKKKVRKIRSGRSSQIVKGNIDQILRRERKPVKRQEQER